MGETVWAFLNSNLGITLVVALLASVGGWIFKKVPRAEKLFEEFKPYFFDAVKHAEAAIGESTGSTKKAKLALQYILALKPELAKREADVKKAIEMAHAEKKKKVTGGA